MFWFGHWSVEIVVDRSFYLKAEVYLDTLYKYYLRFIWGSKYNRRPDFIQKPNLYEMSELTAVCHLSTRARARARVATRADISGHVSASPVRRAPRPSTFDMATLADSRVAATRPSVE